MFSGTAPRDNSNIDLEIYLSNLKRALCKDRRALDLMLTKTHYN